VIPIGLDKGQRRLPWMSIGLAVLNTAVYIQTAGRPDFEQIKVAWGFVPRFGCLATLVSHMFLHDNPLHLVGNLIFFIVPAMKLEDAIGGLRMCWLYLMGGMAANACHVLMAGDWPIPLVGASGAIAGIVGSFMVLYPLSRMIFWLLPPLPITVRLPTWFFLGYWFLREIVTGYLMQTGQIDSLVAVWAHVGGFAFGALSMLCFYGWNSGLRLEALRTGPLAEWLAPEPPRRSRLARAGRRNLAVALQGLVILYAFTVLFQGGVINRDRPTNQLTLAVAIIRDPDRRQVVREQFRAAVGRASAKGFLSQVSRSVFLNRLSGEIDQTARRHAALRRKGPSAQGKIADLQRFLDQELPRFPEEVRMDVEDIQPMSVLYAPGEDYELVYGSRLTPAMVFCLYLDKLNERGWSLDRPIFDLDSQAGQIEASHGRWEQAILVAPSPRADRFPVTTVWRLWKS